MKRQQAFLGSLFRTALSTRTLLNPLKLNTFLGCHAVLGHPRQRPDAATTCSTSRLVRTGSRRRNVVFATVPLGNVDYRPDEALGSTVLWNQRQGDGAVHGHQRRPADRRPDVDDGERGSDRHRRGGRALAHHRAGLQRRRRLGPRRQGHDRPDQARASSAPGRPRTRRSPGSPRPGSSTTPATTSRSRRCRRPSPAPRSRPSRVRARSSPSSSARRTPHRSP